MSELTFVQAVKITSLIENFGRIAGNWFNALLFLLGVVMVGVGVYKLAKALITHGQGQPPNWIVIGALIILGGVFIGGNFQGLAENFIDEDVSAAVHGSSVENNASSSVSW